MSSTKNIFLLGVGCQKGGTSWLHKQLSENVFFDAGFEKEYHTFNCLLEDDKRHSNSNFDSELESIALEQKKEDAIDSELSKKIKCLFRSNTNAYYKYFTALLNKSSSTYVTGDFTPAYAGLSANTFKSIKREFKNRNIETRVIFIMRDPMERVWSQIRMRRRNHAAKHPSAAITQSEQDAVLERYNEDAVQLRTRYENTIRNIELAFDKNEVLYILYEDLFSNTTKQKIESFIGVQLQEFNRAEKVNVSPKSVDTLDENVKSLVVNYYEETYRFCDLRFSVKDKWKNYRFLNRTNTADPNP